MKTLTALLGILTPMISFAHSGHGPVDDGLAHYLLSPLHLIGVLAVAIVGIGIYKYVNREKA